MAAKFRKPHEIKVVTDKKTGLSCRVRKSIKEKLIFAARLTPEKLPLAVFVEQVLEDYVKYIETSKKGVANE